MATTLLKASTMQNVPWPMTTVVKPRSHPSRMKVLRSATPVTMPGRAMGSTMRNDRELRPKNLYRWSANDRHVPSTSATAVAASASFTEVQSASRGASAS